jgi:uncharacterized protein YbjQ (UPF0145 family)
MSTTCANCSKDMSKKGFFLSPQDLPHKTFPDICGACGYQNKDLIKAAQRKERSEAEAVKREQEERKRLEIQSKKLRITEALERVDNILVMSIEHVPSNMEAIGLVRGSTARAKNAISDFGAGLKNLVGGEVVAYTQLIADAREQALQRLKEDAAKLEADMIVGVRFTSTTVDTGISEILAYGTALKRIVDE